MATVETRNLTKRFTGHGGEGVHAVDGIDLLIQDGEFMVLLGPSGCGKTTLLRMIGGLEPPTAGEILIGGRVVNGLPPRARQIAMVFQSYALYPHLDVYNNIAFPLKAAKLSKHEQREKVEAAQAQAAPALRRSAAARRARPRPGPRPERVSPRRAALEPGCPAPRLGPGRVATVPAPGRDDDDLRHPRPGRGDGHGG
jgi:multiple sugar transport system ATP-binding protein